MFRKLEFPKSLDCDDVFIQLLYFEKIEIKREPDNILIELLIASSLTPKRLLMPPHLLLSTSSMTPH